MLTEQAAGAPSDQPECVHGAIRSQLLEHAGKDQNRGMLNVDRCILSHKKHTIFLLYISRVTDRPLVYCHQCSTRLTFARVSSKLRIPNPLAVTCGFPVVHQPNHLSMHLPWHQEEGDQHAIG